MTRLDGLASMRVVVTNALNEPVRHARAFLVVPTADGRERTIRSALSDLHGVARLDFVRDGSYKLRLQASGFTPHEEPLVVAAGEGSREIPVRLEVAPPAAK